MSSLASPIYRFVANRLSPAGQKAKLSILIFHRVLLQADPLFPGEATVESFDDALRVIEQLETLDPDSFNFRYPTNLRGERSISPHHVIGQRTILEVLDDLAFFRKNFVLLFIPAQHVLEFAAFVNFRTQSDLVHQPAVIQTVHDDTDASGNG